MRIHGASPPAASLLAVGGLVAALAACHPTGDAPAVDPGPRALALLDQLEPGPLRERLDACRDGPFRATTFSIGHRGAPRHHPEHTVESYVAAARMGAGVLECDVTFTSDRVFVCRHSQCDLAPTTNILQTPLAGTCRTPFRPAELAPGTGEVLRPARARCCTSDLTLAQFRSLRGRHDRVDPSATTVDAFLAPSAPPMTGAREPGAETGTLVTHDESIALFDRLGVAMAPELKATDLPEDSPIDYPRRAQARDLIAAYRRARISPRRVFPQSFHRDDLATWRETAPDYAQRAVWLDGRSPAEPTPPLAEFQAHRRAGLQIIAPPLPWLLRATPSGEIVASDYARRAKRAGLDIIAWTLERSGRIEDGRVDGRDRDFYLSPILPALRNDGDVYRILEALHQQVGVLGVFSDWPAAPTYYASCFGLD